MTRVLLVYYTWKAAKYHNRLIASKFKEHKELWKEKREEARKMQIASMLKVIGELNGCS